ncbi:MAG: multifunctional CCA addition/repair protein [Porticoccaceae bacterium]
MKIFLVGGAVRDKLLGIPVRERDWVVVNATPAEMEQQGFRPVGSDFPVFIHPDTGEEYALARTERKSGQGHKGFHFHTGPGITLEDDLSRRDLTINAIAEDSNGQLIDPYGGRRDLADRVLRHVSPAFVEDPLRVLRVARFAARYRHLGFALAEATRELMRSLSASGELMQLTPERSWRETQIALAEDSPRTYIETLRDCGALAVLFPEIEALFGVPQRADYHPEVDTGIHLLMALDQAVRLSARAEVRFAVLMHDLGKGITPAALLPRHTGHEEGGVPLVNAFCDCFRVPNHYRRLALVVTRFHLQCHQIASLRPATVLNLLKGVDAFRNPQALENFLLACEADARGRKNLENTPYESALWLRQLFRTLSQVGAADLVADGLTGADIGRALDDRRLKMIAAYKDSAQ